MLTNRKIEILKQLYSSKNQFLPAKNIADFCNVSVRTIKNEIRELREILSNNKCANIISVPSKGYSIEIYDELIFLSMVENNNEKEIIYTLNDKDTRIKNLLATLLDEKTALSRIFLQRKLYVSESTLYLDIKSVREILFKYNLKLEYLSNKGYLVIGKEEDKRLCIKNENIIYFMIDEETMQNIHMKKLTYIKDLLIKTFMENEYRISERLFESLILHLVLSLRRIEKGHVIKMIKNSNIKNEKEYLISKIILKKLLHLSETDLENEIIYFALNLRGKRDFDDSTIISEEIDSFINESLDKIGREFGVNFSKFIDLKVALAMHFVPLITRMRYNMQLKNVLIMEIKQQFPFAFDIASYFSVLINEKYKIQITEDEIAYFSLYFNYGLLENVISSEGKKILIISSLKRSETILLKQRILQWIKDQISEIDIVNPFNIKNYDIFEYDALFTTEESDTITKGAAIKINLFPNDRDFSKMNMAINGYNSADSILNCFHKDLFYVKKVKDRKAAVSELIMLANKKYNDIPEKFEQLIYDREELSSTYFSNGVAIPHPLYPITETTFVVVGILEEEIEWDENHNVSIVLLMSTEANNPKAFHIWTYLSSIVCNKNVVDQIKEIKEYNRLIEILESCLSNYF